MINRLAPKEVMRDAEGKVVGLKVQRISALYDYNGRFSPQAVPNSEFVIPCDAVALAIGQGMDSTFLKGWDKKEQLTIDRGIIKTERGSGRTSVPGIYAGGDAAFGPALFITAIRHGQEAARSIDSDLRGTRPTGNSSGNLLK